MPRQAKPAKPDLTSVRTLVTSASELARVCEVTPNAIYRWIKVNRIPGKYLTKVCNLYDIELRDILPLTGSDKSNNNVVLTKPRSTLDELLKVYQGKATIEDAERATGVSERSLKLIMFHWGDELPTLHTTLKQLAEGRITLDDAATRLKVTKYTLHGIRKKYGYAPGVLKRTRPRSQIGLRRDLQKQKALDVIAGRIGPEQAALDLEASYRSIFRYIERITPHKLNDLTHWPRSFRAALSEEINRNLSEYVVKWLKIAEQYRLVLGKYTKYPETPESWRKEPLKRLLVGVLLGEASLEEVAASRGGEPEILAGLFDGELQPLGLTWDTTTNLPVAHQTALAELFLAMLSRKRRQP